MVSTNIKISQRSKLIDDCIENPTNDIIQNNQPLEEKPVENSQNSQIPDETPAIAINGWNKLTDVIVEKILIQAIKSSDHVCGTSNINSCSRFQIIGKKWENVASLYLYQTR